MKESNATAKIVVGHHPIHSNGGTHGDTETLKPVKEIMGERNAKVYVNGHDHNLQAIREDGLAFITSGAGSDLRRDIGQGPHDLSFSCECRGFVVIEAFAGGIVRLHFVIAGDPPQTVDTLEV